MLNRGRGGARQRALRAALGHDEPNPPIQLHDLTSALAEELIQLWCWGGISPQLLQKLSAAAKKDMMKVRAHIKDDILSQVGSYLPEEMAGVSKNR